ncbi:MULTISPECIES: carbohydrate ABC transporter permease [Caldilinea]|jgi:multiple sugar transport system permease protein|uniref:Putative ABC transporter permease protein n=1 Tax=Caldilinea aerophila (strain DSM 14535 / JCM 11387 / NBRC 104270 / STL-6-O1) TaxID=926550 RepID=I0I2B7_CALAS|nr:MULTISPECIES: sugar ABC transporter permease [Caldilinea]MBO9394407.1 sugar ABC transporter permease [Caldilinea sp.]BAL99404.1 putative ABC transporter permease protein [Caldilinea aerophila DSM 14535 = NBRC 104270]GIV74002.1 MAG: ABC transporter permease [Caldilinea sp.]
MAALETSTRPPRRADPTKFFFIMPAVIWVLLFTIFPLLYALYTSFFSFRFGRINQFVGFANYVRLFTDSNLHNGLRVTLTFVLVTVTIQMLLGFGLALLLNREMRGKSILRAIMVLPLFATPVAVGYLSITLFYEINGPINELLRALGGTGIPWLSNPFWALVAVIIIDIWQWTPFVFLVSLAALQSLPADLYEAAEVDGASGWQSFRSITLPLMTPILWLILLLRLVEAFKVFDIPTSLTLGGPGRATEVYSLFTYRTALRFFDHGYAAAQGFLLLFIVSLIVALLFGRIRSIYQEERS